MKKNDLLRVFEEKKPQKFQLELAINLWLMTHRKKAAWVKSSSYNPHKVRKLGFWRGMLLDLRNDLNLMAYAGLVNYYKQLFLFCRRKIKA